ncbi:hypothetical protein CENSYa_0540 [Cenarchaeum symbiosum A]|uniref:Uncharacterized protein n=1 Tax=Cenarchaeum symbiosum (strain A) TaxID=414004 RepID=A0RV06_CENSY|nr:hypothetical protein CENSYa_0540 [Cenarchaeum symbiosum A]
MDKPEGRDGASHGVGTDTEHAEAGPAGCAGPDDSEKEKLREILNELTRTIDTYTIQRLVGAEQAESHEEPAKNTKFEYFGSVTLPKPHPRSGIRAVYPELKSFI